MTPSHGYLDWGLVAIFVTVYLGMILGGLPRLKLDRSGVALLGAIGVIGLGAMNTEQAARAVDLPTAWTIRVRSCTATFTRVKEIGQAFGLHFATVSRVVRAVEIAMNKRAFYTLLTVATLVFNTHTFAGGEC